MDGSTYVVRNEVDPDASFHCDALASHFPDAQEINFPAGERFDLDDAEAVVFTGSTVSVYEDREHPWIDEQNALVRDLLSQKIPTLGVCFGHQLINAALGGTVESREMTARVVTADLSNIPLFNGVEPAVPALHGDIVTEAGDELEIVASADHAPIFGTRHPDAPLWTVQFHPEIDRSVRDSLAAFGWENCGVSFAELTAVRVFENFERLAVDSRRRD